MLDSITIKNFKAITELTLNNLASVNYLVGKNGCGKSSVLENLKLLELILSYKFTHDINIEDFKKYYFNIIKNDYEVNFFPSKSGSKAYIFNLSLKKEAYHDRNNSNKINVINKVFTEKTNSHYYTSSIKSNFSISTKNMDSYFEGKDASYLGALLLNTEDLGTLIDLMELLTSPRIAYVKYNPQSKKIDAVAVEIVNSYENIFIPEKIELPDFEYLTTSDQLELKTYINDNFGINAHHLTKEEIILDPPSSIKYTQLSDGQKSMLKLYSSLLKYKDFDIICFDEPEESFHPTFQKLIPKLINNFSSKHGIQFIISTHSPFIISAAAEFQDSQKVYLIEAGQTVDINQINNDRGKIGYSGSDCIYAASKMLGSSIQDFAPSKIVFGEKSICTFLKTVNSRFYNKNIQFKPVINTNTKTGETCESASDYNIINLFEKYEEIYKLSDNLYENIDLIFMIDTPKQSEKARIKLKLKAHKQLNTFVLKEEKLEKIYPNSLRDKFISSSKDLGPATSKYKQGLAEYVGNNITQPEFEQIEIYNNYGNNELDSKLLHNLIFK